MRGCSGKSAGNFNPRPPCGGRLSGGDPFAKGYISTHALLAEGDGRRPLSLFASNTTFQPTPSLRRATSSRAGAGRPSPHFNPRPPCGGRPRVRGGCSVEWSNFNPRPPCGGRPVYGDVQSTTEVFQPTPSLRRATPQTAYTNGCPAEISTHALLAEGDAGPTGPAGAQGISTHALLAEGDRPAAASALSTTSISTHALLAEGDARFPPERRCGFYFNPRPPCGGRPFFSVDNPARTYNFNPRPPCGGRRASRMRRWSSAPTFQPTPSLRRATSIPRARL